MNKSLPQPARILKIYMNLTGFSHINHPDDLNNTLLSQDGILENVSSWGSGRQDAHSKDRGSNCPDPASDQSAVMSSKWPPPTQQTHRQILLILFYRAENQGLGRLGNLIEAIHIMYHRTRMVRCQCSSLTLLEKRMRNPRKKY